MSRRQILIDPSVSSQSSTRRENATEMPVRSCGLTRNPYSGVPAPTSVVVDSSSVCGVVMMTAASDGSRMCSSCVFSASLSDSNDSVAVNCTTRYAPSFASSNTSVQNVSIGSISSDSRYSTEPSSSGGDFSVSITWPMNGQRNSSFRCSQRAGLSLPAQAVFGPARGKSSETSGETTGFRITYPLRESRTRR